MVESKQEKNREKSTMAKKKLTTDEQLAMVLSGMKRNIPVSDLCRQYGLSQAIRDHFLAGAKAATSGKAVERKLHKRIEDLEDALQRGYYHLA